MNLAQAKATLVAKKFEVEDAEVVKNGYVKNAITVGTGRIRPNLYEESVEKIETEEELIEMVSNAIERMPNLDIDEIMSRENAIANVVSCIRHETNDDSIVKFPVMGDLEEYFRLQIGDEMSIVLKKEHLDVLDASEEEIREWGRANLRKQVSIQDMVSVLAGLMGLDKDFVPDYMDTPKMFIATNRRKTNGASVVLLTDCLDEFCAEQGIRHLAILPSSIHEVILVDCDESEGHDFDSLIQAVNTEKVEAEERLSSHAYYYTPAC